VWQKAIRSLRDARSTGDDDDAGVPLPAQRRDAPPAQALSSQHDRQHRPAQPANESATQRHRLHQTSHQQTGVQSHHYRVMPRTELDAATLAAPE